MTVRATDAQFEAWRSEGWTGYRGSDYSRGTTGGSTATAF